jgi:hypothetical protein|tara:strand:+ start:716 stop:820 length:105 start_codon:yes stop_codon:yes gene_type:complete
MGKQGISLHFTKANSSMTLSAFDGLASELVHWAG